MRKLLFWIGFAMPLVQTALVHVIDHGGFGASVVSMIAMLLILASAQHEKTILLATICVLDKGWRLMYLPVGFEIVAPGITYWVMLSVAIVSTIAVVTALLRSSSPRTAQG